MKKKPAYQESVPKKRRKRSIPHALPMTKEQIRWSADVKVNGFKSAMSRRCPKCQGLLTAQMLDLTTKNDIRCINCGWQPQWGTRVVTESAEVRSIRRQTAQFCTTDLAS